MSKRGFVSRCAQTLIFSDRALQDSLYHEYKKVCLPPAAVRIARSGAKGRFAVVYFACMADVHKALSDRVAKQGASSLLTMGDAHLFLADDQIADP